MSTPPAPTLLSIRGLTKTFGGSPALSGVELDIAAGEVHGLLGENGSGKSTLIKVLAGYYQPDAGEIEVRGVRIELPLAAGQYRRLGFAFVHQDLALIPNLSVTENLLIGKFASARGVRIKWAAERRRARDVCHAYGLDVDPAADVEELEPVQRALLAIIRAVSDMDDLDVADSGLPRLLVLDEPTVFLPQEQVTRLFELMRTIAARGSSVLFVSHDLNEVCQVTDRVTVLRDGKVVGTRVTAETDVSDLVAMIVGRHLKSDDRRTAVASSDAAELIRVDDLTTKSLSNVSFSAREGEILGLTGLLGSGHDDIPYAIFGARSDATGDIFIAGNRFSLRLMSPRRAMSLGMALVPADRHRDGAIASLSVTDNMTSVTLDRYFHWFHLGRQRMRRDAARLASEFDVRPRDPDLDYISLSGGNQQKALLAKWLQLSPRVILLHEPTQGVDIGARQQIFELLRSARSGRVVICTSSDHEQLAAICDRVLIFGHGRLVSELSGSDVAEHRITEECLMSTVSRTTVLT